MDEENNIMDDLVGDIDNVLKNYNTVYAKMIRDRIEQYYNKIVENGLSWSNEVLMEIGKGVERYKGKGDEGLLYGFAELGLAIVIHKYMLDKYGKVDVSEN